MRMPDIKGIVNVGKSLIMANRPEILLGAAIAATGAAVVLAAKGGYDSGRKVAHIELEKSFEELATKSIKRDWTNLQANVVPVTKAELFQLTWRNYVPAALATTTSLGAITGLHFIHVHEKRILVASGLAAVEETRKAAQDYIDDLEDSVDANTTKKVKEKIDEDIRLSQLDRHGSLHQWNDGVITEMYLVRDARTGRDIWSNQSMIDQAVNELNAELTHVGEVSVAKFYEEAGFPPVDDAEEFGWCGRMEVKLEWKNDNRLDGRPVRSFRFQDEPEKGFDAPHR